MPRCPNAFDSAIGLPLTAGARWDQGSWQARGPHLIGSDVTTSAKDWIGFKGIWKDECSDEFHEAEAQFSMQDGVPQPTGCEGALVVVNVVDYHYVSVGARVMLGVMTGNASINAKVGFRDLKTAEMWATKTYDTKSWAWNGVVAAMTTKQVRRDGVTRPLAR